MKFGSNDIGDYGGLGFQQWIGSCMGVLQLMEQPHSSSEMGSPDSPRLKTICFTALGGLIPPRDIKTFPPELEYCKYGITHVSGLLQYAQR